MLLAIDIGNTDFTIGVFQGKKLCDTFRMRTKINRTSDEYGVFILNTLQYKGYDTKDVEDVIIASVVPAVMHSFNSAIIKYFGLTPIIVGPGIRTGIRIATTNPKETGADRIVDAVAGYELYGGPVIVVDFGTATTYDLVTEDGRFVGGVTSPGIRTSANALWQQAAKLPEIEIRKPQYILAKDTVTSMQGGLVYGYIGQTEYIIRKMKEEGTHLCCSIGFLTKKQALMLKEAGLDRINHNLNTSRSNYPNICTTHTYEQRVNNIHMLQDLGFEICSGGIIGMGESKEDVVDMLLDLKEINPEALPINFLIPIKGTPLQDRDTSNLTPEYCLKVLCLARLLVPTSDIRCAAGREIYFKGREKELLTVVNSIFASGYLTADGQGIQDTIKTITDAGFTCEVESD